MADKKPTCFVIQEFDDGGTFDRRFSETIQPALIAAEVVPKRADQILGLKPVIEKIEQAIEEASICVAEVSTDNPNVWLELGYALSLNRPTVILCDRGRRERLPFDIQHRPVIFYRCDSRSGFDELEKNIIRNVKAELKKDVSIERAPVLKGGAQSLEDLKDYEVAILSTLLALWPTPNSGATHYDLENKLSSLGFKDVAIGLGVTSLIEKNYILVKEHQESDTFGNTWESKLYQVLPNGISWLRNHEDQLELMEPEKLVIPDDDIPF